MAIYYRQNKALFATDPLKNVKALFFCVATIALIIIDTNSNYFVGARIFLHKVLTPIQYIANIPENVSINISNYFKDRNSLVKKITFLEQRSLVLDSKLQRFEDLLEENSILRKLLQSAPLKENAGTVARIINADLSPLQHKIVVNKGSVDGIVAGHIAIDPSGLIGVVSRVSDNSAIILLVTDLNVGVPVVNKRTGIRSITNGTGVHGGIQLLHVPHTVDVKVGDKFITSGLGEQYPPGYPVGVVQSVQHNAGDIDSTIMLEPAAKLYISKYVLLCKSH